MYGNTCKSQDVFLYFTFIYLNFMSIMQNVTVRILGSIAITDDWTIFVKDNQYDRYLSYLFESNLGQITISINLNTILYDNDCKN